MAPEPKPMLQKPPGFRDPTSDPPTKKPVPPRKPVLPPSFRPKPRRRGCCRICCCTLCILLVVFLFSAAIAAGLIYILYDPSVPQFHLESFDVPLLNVTVKANGAFLDADTRARVELKNRNKNVVWYFGDTMVDVSEEKSEVSLGSTKVSGFPLKEKDLKEVKSDTSVRGMPLDERQKNTLQTLFPSKGLVPHVQIRTKVAVGMAGWKSGKLDVSIVCGRVTVKQIGNGQMPLCELTILRWIKLR